MLTYRDLKVWQKSMLLVKKVYAITKSLPKEETYALSDQMRRAVISIPSNVAEGERCDRQSIGLSVEDGRKLSSLARNRV